eukprot:TRINITY_DN12620_c1_g1_i1.p1 TRINITY_DN12620_c1_g1~~TRINITY_DN12620_c1_g1_i1.p1  ORF type:complete len:513 (-),score=76.87 TRINITY_DN12620_c1_g1_i1:60-1598(-)
MASIYDEEEEEEENIGFFWRGGPPAQAPVQHESSDQGTEDDEDEHEEELHVPCEEDVVEAIGNAVQQSWNVATGLRQRWQPQGGADDAAAWSGDNGANVVAGGLFADEHLDEVQQHINGQFGGSRARRLPWRRVSLGMACLTATLLLARLSRPDKASFTAMKESRYVLSPEKRDASVNQSHAIWRSPLPLLTDRSFEGHIAWSRFVDHAFFSFATVSTSVTASPASKKNPTPPKKLYEHKFLGLFGTWIPLLYLPQPGQKQGHFGVGLCVLSRCICVPDLRGRKGKKKNAGESEVGGSSNKHGCWRFEGGKSAALNFIAVPNLVIFFLWQWTAYWGKLSKHAVLSWENLRRGRLWVLLSAPFSHRNWQEALRSAMMLANTIDSFDSLHASFAIFLLLYVGGCWSTWLLRTLVWRGLVCGEPALRYMEEYGAFGGIAAQWIFLARARPEARYRFSFYMIPIPIELSAWRSLFGHVLVDLFGARDSKAVTSLIVAHVASWAFGCMVYEAWSQHV